MTSRMAHLLGELRREMNGAVVGSMRYYGADYGLNYGVSIPTIRSLGRAESLAGGDDDHRFAKYLYQQEVRELRLISLWFADPMQVATELDFWSRGVVNSEVAEEGAFVLFSRVEGVEDWIYSDSELLHYCAMMSMVGREGVELLDIEARLLEILESNPSLMSKGVIAFLDRYLRRDGGTEEVVRLLDSMPSNGACANIRAEIAWRMEV